MLKLITGIPGTGKTKTLIKMVNEAVKNSKGNVVCVDKGIKLRFDIDYNVRLINIDEYLIYNAQAWYGFVAGLIAATTILRYFHRLGSQNLRQQFGRV